MTRTFEESQIPHSTYRGDIEGLRCVAVLTVLLFHLPLRLFSGGYVGVDIFFVISGYLITGIVVRDLSKGTFSFAKFYERRVRRIFPALFALLAITSAVAFLILLPGDLRAYARSMIAACLSYSNLYFQTQEGYFTGTRVKFLLHTWSLSVEEQFYLLFPAALLALSKLRRGFVGPVCLLCLLSFVISSVLVFTKPEVAFFTPVSRAWELLIGAILAATPKRPQVSPVLRDALAWVGLFGFMFCFTCYTAKTPFPGLSATLPTFATVLLLWTGEGEGTLVGRMLSFSPLRFIGQISYSLYLWHWPLILFAKLGLLPGVSAGSHAGKFIIFAFSMLAGYLSWRFVEQPFRTLKTLASRKQLFAVASSCALVLCLLAVAVLFTAGFPYRFTQQAQEIGNYLDRPQEMQIGSCFITSASSFDHFDVSHCMTTVSGKKNYLLLGDSHAAVLWYGLHKNFPEVNFLQATVSGCEPTVGFYDRSDCGRLRNFIYADYFNTHSVDGVILSMRWDLGSRFDSDIRHKVDALQSSAEWFKAHNIPVLLIGPVQEYDLPLPLILVRSLQTGDQDSVVRHQVAGYDLLDRYVQQQAQRWGVQYVSLWRWECSTGTCMDFVNPEKTVPMLIDPDHLSNEASFSFIGNLKKAGTLPWS